MAKYEASLMDTKQTETEVINTDAYVFLYLAADNSIKAKGAGDTGRLMGLAGPYIMKAMKDKMGG